MKSDESIEQSSNLLVRPIERAMSDDGMEPTLFMLFLLHALPCASTKAGSFGASEEFVSRATNGSAEAQCVLGYAHWYGLGVPASNALALEWFSKSAAQGNARAQNNLGVMYEVGYGATPDLGIAESWYRKAADQGVAEAANNLGVLLLEKSESSKEGAALVRAAAHGGSIFAAFNLGVLYLRGEPYRRDDAAAFTWLRKAADAGVPPALHNLGVLQLRIGEKLADVAARGYFESAAERGFGPSAHNLGVMAARRLGGLNPEGASNWLDRARSAGWDRRESSADRRIRLAVVLISLVGVVAFPIKTFFLHGETWKGLAALGLLLGVWWYFACRRETGYSVSPFEWIAATAGYLAACSCPLAISPLKEGWQSTVVMVLWLNVFTRYFMNRQLEGVISVPFLDNPGRHVLERSKVGGDRHIVMRSL